MDPKHIERGWDVYGSDGEKVGDVSDVQRAYITVSRGFIFTSERYVPISAIERIEHDRVKLGVTKDEIEARGWDTIPDELPTVEDRPARAPQAVRITEPERTARRDEAERPDRRDEGQTIELREEELRARKERVQAGEGEITKDVVSEEKTLEVPVMHEEVTVERRAVDRRPSDRPIGEGETIDVPVYEEKVEFDKQAVVHEELSVGKRQVQVTERVSDTIRREVVDVETEGDLDVDDGVATRGGDEPSTPGRS